LEGSRLGYINQHERQFMSNMTLVPYATLVAVSHLMRRSSLGNPLMTKIAVVFELPLVQVLQDTLFFFGRLFHALVEFILSRVFCFLPFSLDRLRVARTINTVLFSWIARGGYLLRMGDAYRKPQKYQQAKQWSHAG